MRPWVGMLLFGAACATAQPLDPGPKTSTYWPLKSGEILTFETQAAGGQSTRKVRIKKLKNGWFQVGPGQRLRHDADGLFDGQRYLMRRPLKVGTAWNAIPKPGVIERFRTVRVGAQCPQPLNEPAPCLAIEARQNVAGQVLLTRWWYAKGKGLMQVEVFVQKSSGTLRLQSRLRRKEKP